MVLDLGGLVTESRNPRTLDLDLIDLESALTLMNDEDIAVVAAVRGQIPAIAKAVRLVEAALKGGGRLFYVGAGTSGRLGILDAAECPPTFGTSPELVQAIMAGGGEAADKAKEGWEDDIVAGRGDLLAKDLSSRDVVVGLAASGRTPYVVGALDAAREMGAKTVAVVCNPSGPLLDRADVGIAAVVGPEVVMGSTRLKAGTAQKLILNMISTIAMVRLGRVYTNLMVDMRASNAKIRSRAVRIMSSATGLGFTEAEAALAKAGGSLKAALVAHLAGVDVDEAEARLKAAGGYVRAAVGGPIQSPAVSGTDGRSFYLGIDGGQSGTRCLIVRDDGEVCGQGEAGKIEFLLAPGGREKVAEVLRQATAEAMGTNMVAVSAAFLGLTGVVAGGRMEEAARQVGEEVLSAGQVFVDNDGIIAWAGALGLRPGLIAIAGSGSLVLGVDADGKVERAGGWGYLFGDEPGAFGIALTAIKQAIKDEEAGRASVLLAEVLAYFGAGDVSWITKGFYAGEIDRAKVAGFAPRLASMADAHPEAAALFDQAANILARQMVHVAGRLRLPDARLEWSPIGGVFRCGDVFLRPLRRHLKEEARFTFVRVQPELPPVAGAVLLAVRRSGGTVTGEFISRLRRHFTGGNPA